MENVLIKISKIFKEIEEKHNLINFKLFEENNNEIENEILNYIIKLLINGTPYHSFKIFIEIYIKEKEYNNKLMLNDLKKITIIKNCLKIIHSYDKEKFIELSMSICKNEKKDEISRILNLI